MQTRERILAAALACFSEDGYERTTVARIRERSGVSNGALFHHFASKKAIAGALYVEAMRSVQEGHWALLTAHPATLDEAIRGVVAHQLQWTQDNPEWAAFLYAQGHLDWSSTAAAELHSLNRDLAIAYRDWLAPFVDRGEARPLSMIMLTAIVTGPAHAVAQRWLAKQLDGELTGFVDELAEAAIAGVSSTPGASRAEAPLQQAHESRVRVQLLTSDGVVTAEGEAVVVRPPPR
ncbi:MAG: TetR/AcrR family transcriptional regulator [Solirubrobacteraceae bacterium]|nr:TetR/AcrR family transcriptional regulator [Solirubrobacteraceae bacterium]